MNWRIDYNIMALVIIAIVLTVYFMRERFENRAGRLFVILATAIFVATIFDIISVYYNSNVDLIPIWLNYVLTDIYYISFNSLPIVGYVYVVEWVKKGKANNLNRTLSYGAVLIHLILIISTPFTHWSFYFEDGIYKHGPLHEVHVAIAIILLIASFLICFINRKQLGFLKKYAVYFFVAVAIIAVVFQLFSPEVLLINFIASLFVLVIYLTLQNPENYLDKKSECLNKKAFYRILLDKLQAKDEGAILFLEFECFSYINRMIGVEAENEILNHVADYLRKNYGKRNIFHLSYGKFAILYKNQEEAIEAARSISIYFEKKEHEIKVKVSLIPQICIIKYPQVVSSLEDIMDISTYFFEEKKGMSVNDILVVDEDLLIEKKRKNEILQAVKRAIKTNAFDVYFQPIIETKTGEMKSAEALVRLFDEKLGFISPEEFILVAEENGCIIDIDRIVLEKVCKFLSTEKLSKFALDYIEINLSVVELMQMDFSEQIFCIMNNYGISKDQIIFEITETAYMNTESAFSKNIKQIIDKGIRISMDDYGTGFSNMSNLIKYPYKLVKIDKSILWEAMKYDNAKIVLENTVILLKKIGREIVAEGVETEEQIKLLQKLEVDKIQGYYYSRPLSKDDFKKYLIKKVKREQVDGI